LTPVPGRSRSLGINRIRPEGAAALAAALPECTLLEALKYAGARAGPGWISDTPKLIVRGRPLCAPPWSCC